MNKILVVSVMGIILLAGAISASAACGTCFVPDDQITIAMCGGGGCPSVDQPAAMPACGKGDCCKDGKCACCGDACKCCDGGKCTCKDGACACFKDGVCACCKDGACEGGNCKAPENAEFSAATNYMSMAGYLRWQAFLAGQGWATTETACTTCPSM